MNQVIWGRINLKVLSHLKTISHIHVYTALSSFQGGKEKCNPSLQAISDRMTEYGMFSKNGEPYKIRRISQIIGELKEKGLVKSHRVGLGRSNTYHLGQIEQVESRIASEANQTPEAIQSRVHTSDPESRTASESYRKEHLKRTSEKNIPVAETPKIIEPGMKPQASIIDPSPSKQETMTIQIADVYPRRETWREKEEREREERRQEKERYMQSCDEARDLFLTGFNKLRGVA